MDSITAKSTGYLLGAQFLRNLAPLLILLLLARMTNPSTVGMYSLALAIATPVFVFAQLGMRTVTLTLHPEARFREYALVQTVAVFLGLAVVFLCALVGAVHLVLIVVLAALLKSSDAFADLLSGPLQRHGKSATVFVASLLTATAVSLVAAVVLALTRDLTLTLAALAASSLVATYLALFRPARTVSLALESPALAEAPYSDIKRIVRAGLPLGVSMSLLSLVSTVPQYMVASHFGEAMTARLAVLLYVYALADIVTGVVSQAWIPHAQSQLRAPNSLSTMLNISARGALTWTLVYLPLTLAGLFIASWLIPIVFGSAYTLSLKEAIPLGIAVVLLPSAHFMATSVAIQNDYVHTLTVAVGSTLLSLGAGAILIPQIGIAGAFWAIVVAVAARAAISSVIVFARSRSGLAR